MPHSYTKQFIIRHYECDAYGHLNNANYLRFMQESAFSASTDAGYGPAAYRSLNAVWLIRQTEVEYLMPVGAEDVVEVKTWVEGFRRATSRRAYTFTNAVTGNIVARAYSDWVYLNRTTMRPATIPDVVISAFFPEGAPQPSPSRQPFPQPPPPPPGVFNWKRRVEWRDLDGMHHLTNAAYLSYAEDCAVRLAESFGWPFTRWQEEGVAFVAHRNRIVYLQPALLEDDIEIKTWLYSLRAATATRYYAFTNARDGALFAQLMTDWVLIDLKSGKPTRLPDSFRDLLAPNIAA